ncbi:MAG: DegV family protein [Bacillota bacterium]|nr:DegV family protein [Bacillota bacterium]
MTVKILADSICSPSLEKVEEMGITIVPINIHFGEHVYRDLFEIKPEEIYRRLSSASELPTTSAPSVKRFAEAFKTVISEGQSLICFTVTSLMSNSYNVALQARSEFTAEEASRICIFDTEAAGAPAALMVIEAARLAEEGFSLAEIEARASKMAASAKLVVMLDTLKYIEKSGRVGKVTAVAGDLFNVKPLICLHRGKTHFFGRARGKTQAARMILNEFVKDTREARNVRVAATHANAGEDLEPLIRGVKEKFPDIEIDIISFTPAMGFHAGPGIIGIGYTYFD